MVSGSEDKSNIKEEISSISKDQSNLADSSPLQGIRKDVYQE